MTIVTSVFNPIANWILLPPLELPHKVDTKDRASLVRSRELYSLQQVSTRVTASWNDYDGDGFTLGLQLSSDPVVRGHCSW